MDYENKSKNKKGFKPGGLAESLVIEVNWAEAEWVPCHDLPPDEDWPILLKDPLADGEFITTSEWERRMKIDNKNRKNNKKGDKKWNRSFK